MSLFYLVREQSFSPLQSSHVPPSRTWKSHSYELIHTTSAGLLTVISISNLSRQLIDTTLLSPPLLHLSCYLRHWNLCGQKAMKSINYTVISYNLYTWPTSTKCLITLFNRISLMKSCDKTTYEHWVPWKSIFRAYKTLKLFKLLHILHTFYHQLILLLFSPPSVNKDSLHLSKAHQEEMLSV